MSDPDDLSAPRDPGSYGRARLMGPAFWLLIVFGLVCIAAGYGVAKFGPRLFPAKPATAEPTATSFFGPAPQPPPLPAPAPAPVAEGSAPADVAKLSERLEALETRQGRAAQASAEALAAAALLEAAQTSRPFPSELAALEAVLPPSADLSALRPYAERGAPSRSALAASFPEYAARAAAASRSPQEDAGLLARIGQTLSRVVTLRRVGDVPGKGVDALIARAEGQLLDGDLIAALTTLDTLPPAGRGALAPWRERAEGRAVIDRRIADIRNRALRDLAQFARSGG